MTQGPRISIIVITYNSSAFVLETLESAAAQSYQNIELIVTDDHSTDNTVQLCTEWTQKNAHRFERTSIIVSQKNTGIAPNCNRGLRAALGQWIKVIAGDDILLPDCLLENYNYVQRNDEVKVLLSAMNIFQVTETGKQIEKCAPAKEEKKMFELSASLQAKKLLTNNFVTVAPTSFIEKDTLISVGGYNEAYPFIEDYPLWYKLSKNNVALHYMDVTTVMYRSGSSITRVSDSWISKLYYSSLKGHFKQCIAGPLRLENKRIFFKKKMFFLKNDILINIFNNRRNFFSRSFNYIFERVFRLTN